MAKKLTEYKPTRILLSQILSQLEISAIVEQYLYSNIFKLKNWKVSLMAFLIITIAS